MITHTCMHADINDHIHTFITIVHSQVGWSPLMIASFKGHVDIVRLLVEAKAQLNTQIEVYTANYSYHQYTSRSAYQYIL